MARGKSLDDSELRIVETDIEEGNVPYFIIDKNYGIACDSMNEILVVKKDSKRTNTDNPDDPFIEQYIKWEAIGYYRLFSDAIKGYIKHIEKEKKGKITKPIKNIKEIVDIQHEIYQTVAQALNIENINRDFLDSASLFDERQKLKKEIDEIRETKIKLNQEVENLLKLIDEKRKIIIKK